MASIVIILYTTFAYNSNCSESDLYNRDLRTTIILFTRNVFSHKAAWILSEMPLLALSCLLYSMVSSLMSELDGECLLIREIFIFVNKSLAVLLLPVLFIRYFLYSAFLLPVYFLITLFLLFYWCCCLFTSLPPYFILKLLLYFCLFVDHVNKPIIFVFGAYIYHLRNTISTF